MDCKKIESKISKNSKNIDELFLKSAVLENKNIHLEKLIQRLEKQLENEQFKRHIIEARLQLAERHSDDLQQYSNRLSLIIENMPLRRNQSLADLKQLIVTEIKKLNLGIRDFEIDRAHRMFSLYTVNGWTYYPAIVRFTSWSARNALWSARKDFKWKLSPHLTPRREAILDEARALVQTLDSIEFVFCDRNCIFQAKTKKG